MILEVAILNVKVGQEKAFEEAFRKAQAIIADMKGYCSHQLQQCLEQPGQYLLLVNWETVEDHTIGFRQSDRYQQWKQLLHHFYEPFPQVQHYQVLMENSHKC